VVLCCKVITTSGIRPPSWNLWAKEASGVVGIYISDKLAPQNIGIATEIASISVSVAELLVLPVWSTVSTSGLYLMLRCSPKSYDVSICECKTHRNYLSSSPVA